MGAPTATDFPDPGMIEHLRELAGAEPFVPFTIRMQGGAKFRIEKASHIQFTAFGTPKVYAQTKIKHDFHDFGESPKWHLLNVDAISSISV